MAFNLILNARTNAENVCVKKPVFVNKARSFLVHTAKLNSVDDIKADDLGVWVHKGKPKRQYEVLRSQSGIVYSVAGNNSYTLTRVYYHHKNTPEFRRTIFYINGTLLIVHGSGMFVSLLVVI